MANVAVVRRAGSLPEERPFWINASAALHVLLRLGVALLFVQHGGQKLFGWFGGVNGEGLTVPLVSQFGLAGILELAGGALLLIGFLARPVALVLAGEMVAAYVIAHQPQGGLPIQNQGELAVLYGLVFLYFFGSGAGKLSVDHAIAHRDTSEARPVQPQARPAAGDDELRRRRGHAA